MESREISGFKGRGKRLEVRFSYGAFFCKADREIWLGK
tara:strand:- start:728 stop:841 length:114 start_codon:yes stop_codon:yes gene_type:complete